MTISRGSLIRNFFHSGVVSKLLEAGARVVVLTPYVGHPIFKRYEHPNLLFEPLLPPRGLRLRKLSTELWKAAVFGKTVRNRYRYRVSGRPPRFSTYLLRMIFFAPLGFLPGLRRLLRELDYRLNPEREHDAVIARHKPDLVFSTAAGGDTSVVKAARRLGIPSVDMPKSWDNLSKTLIQAKADRLIVWSEFMKEQAVRFQDYRPEEISVTGGPQFDYYAHPERLLSREAFCAKFGFDPEKKIILYGSSGGNVCDERSHAELIAKAISSGAIPDAQLLIRPHLGYLGDAERFAGLEVPGLVVIDRTDKQDPAMRDRWDVSEEHQKNLFNSLHHADVCVNVASTLTLDSIACGTPVVNVNFDVKPASVHWSTKRLYGTDYIDAIVKAGGSFVETDADSFIGRLTAILAGGKDDGRMRERRAMIEHFLYRVDGKSAERIAGTLLALAGASA